jgi:predicted acetyltransferase
MQIEIVKATLEHEPLVKSLWGLFLHDLSEFADDSWMGDDGEWQPPGAPRIRPPGDRPTQPEPVQVLIARVDDRPVGYAMVAFAPRVFVTPGRDIAMAQFFILKGYRRRGIGRQFAHALFDRFPGKWEAGWVERNTPAARFWPAVVEQYTGGNFVHAPVYPAPDGEPMPGLHFVAG